MWAGVGKCLAANWQFYPDQLLLDHRHHLGAGIVITAAYVLRVTGQVFFGEFDAKKYPDVGDIAITDRVILILLGAPLIILGLYPAIMAPMIESGLRPILALLGGGA